MTAGQRRWRTITQLQMPSDNARTGFELDINRTFQIGLIISCEDLMIIEFNDEETQLLRNILLEQAAEHLTYANPSEVAERLFKLAIRFERSVTTDSIHIA
jgi:hypothetical protein